MEYNNRFYEFGSAGGAAGEDMKETTKLAAFLLALGGFHLLIRLLGYSFIPANALVLDACITAVIVVLTVLGMKNRHNKTKISVVFASLLPALAIFIALVKNTAIVCAVITLVCSMILFFLCISRRSVKIGLGIAYIILMLPVCFFLFIAMVFADLGANTSVASQLSPNAVYLAELIDSDQGALGGDTFVNVTRQGCDIDLFIGELKKEPQRVYVGEWHEFYEMDLRWETDELLYINGEPYVVK